MDEKELKQLLELANKLGARRISLALQLEGLSPRQAEMLSHGDNHWRTFQRKTIAAVRAVLAKQGKARAS
jgi:hypothetical protein